MNDTIVIGARGPGSPTAMLWARRGYRALLVNWATFPSDVVSGYYVQQTRGVQLKRLGLLDKVITSNCPLIYQVAFDLDSFSVRGAAEKLFF